MPALASDALLSNGEMPPMEMARSTPGIFRPNSLISAITCSVVGAGYGVAPIVYIPAPPGPGVQATAIATISNGAVNGFTITNQGAGYTTVPTVSILPNPFDPNAASITPSAIDTIESMNPVTTWMIVEIFWTNTMMVS